MIKRKSGFTLIEIMVGLAIFLIIGLSIWQSYHSILELAKISRVKIAALALVNEKIEIIRNLPYHDVGIQGGSPGGKLSEIQEVVRDNIIFQIKQTVENEDDPFDGLLNGNPDDSSPADYKLVEVEITCLNCRKFSPLRLTTTIAPKNLETTTNHGALFIKVINANGQPVQNAQVHIINNQIFTPLNFNKTTDQNGWLRLIDVPPGLEAYEITVSKSDYSEEKTYPPGDPSNPNPTKPHATVMTQQTTQISFTIDKLSTLNIYSLTASCSPRNNINFSLKGTKLIGLNPEIYKYHQSHSTDFSGYKALTNLEWDSYSLSLTDQFYDLSGSIPLIPFGLNPETSQNLFLVVKLKDPKSLLVLVKDGATNLPLSGVEVTLERIGYHKTLISGRGYLHQTDWQGGVGQENFVDETRYFSQDGNIETAEPTGEIKLLKIGENYLTNGWLISSTFDTGGESNFYNLIWQPQDQPPHTEIKFQIATADTPTPPAWDFLGPDGTTETYYTLAETNVNTLHNDDQYLRYKVFLSTQDQSRTPNVSDIAVTFSSQCVPSGQAFFNNLSSGTYNLTVSLFGYQNHTEEINISDDWVKKEVILNPE